MQLKARQFPIKGGCKMLSSHTGHLTEARSTLIKTFSIVFFLNLHHTYDWQKSNEQRTKSTEQRAKSDEQRAESNKQRVKSNEQRAKSNKKRTKSDAQQAERNKQRAKSNKQRETTKKFSLKILKLVI